ncbi:small multidrug resistance pump [Oryzomicrobium terrae]|uniref:Small multidrug resistance pump n=1 Tax=Oryzomicrobium terrae TaxID=1735038 RepID=A0A5C1EAF5_9RHOO|nr:SMR family transporter [Oryzomicrobium terrae]QEL65258.1 small multidrug resistance pump [Oryzomicrobium terrae]
MHYLYLALAIVSEVIATSLMPLTQGFTRLWPSLAVAVGYGVAFYCLSLTLKILPIGVIYAIWSGAGIALIAVVGTVFFKQSLDTPALIGIGLIVAGVLVLNLFSKTLPH